MCFTFTVLPHFIDLSEFTIIDCLHLQNDQLIKPLKKLVNGDWRDIVCSSFMTSSVFSFSFF